MINYKIAPISIKSSKKNASLSEVFIAQVDQEKENLAGKLFILLEIENKSTNNIKIINFLLNRIYQNYYQSDKLILREKIYSLKPEHIFEASLTKTNKQFNNFLESEKIKFDFKSINLTAGLIFDNELFFANKGKNQVFLIHYHKEAKEKKYKIVNVTKQTKEDDVKKETEDLFSNVINGKIPPLSHFFISNEALPEYLSHKQIIETITTLPPLSAAEQFKNILSQINYYIAFSGIIIKSSKTPGLQGQRTSLRQTPQQENIGGISKTENTTEQILSSSKVFKLTSFLKIPFSLFSKTQKSKNNGPIILKDQIYSKKKTFNFFNKTKILVIFKNFLILLINVLSYLLNIFRSKNFTNIIKSLPRKTVHYITLNKKFLFSLKKKNLILLVVASFFMLLFTFNILQNKKEQKQVVTEKNYQKLIEDIEKKQNQIEANLLYSNDEGAQSLFNDLDLLLKEFPQETEEQKNYYETFQKKFTGQLNLIRRATVYESPELIADLNNLGSNVDGLNILFDEISQNIYIADYKQKSIYIIDTQKNTVTTVTDLGIPISSLKFPVQIDDNSIIYLNQNSFIDLKTENESLANLSITLPVDQSSIIGADSYNNRLYILSNATNQIYRYTKTGNNFSAPLTWINEKLDLSRSVDISIDGSIFVLNDNGSATKLLKGSKTDFSLEEIEPKLTNPTKIVASKNTDFLYILEPKQKRLVVYDKKGQFIIQYTSEKFTDLKGISINEKEKTAYLLNENVIYKAPFSHID